MKWIVILSMAFTFNASAEKKDKRTPQSTTPAHNYDSSKFKNTDQGESQSKNTKEGTTEDSLRDVKSKNRGGVPSQEQMSKPGP